MKIVNLLVIVLIFQSCTRNGPDLEKKYGFTYTVDKLENSTNVHVIDCSDTDFVKYGIFSELMVNELQENTYLSFSFKSENGKTDTLNFSGAEISYTKRLYREFPCVLNADKHIIFNLSNEKILFYDSILYEIMKYDARLHHLDTAYYSKNDVSIVSILHNRCRYEPGSVPEKFRTQSKYIEVLKIWCENKEQFPLYDENDLMPKN